MARRERQGEAFADDWGGEPGFLAANASPLHFPHCVSRQAGHRTVCGRTLSMAGVSNSSQSPQIIRRSQVVGATNTASMAILLLADAQPHDGPAVASAHTVATSDAPSAGGLIVCATAPAELVALLVALVGDLSPGTGSLSAGTYARSLSSGTASHDMSPNPQPPSPPRVVARCH